MKSYVLKNEVSIQQIPWTLFLFIYTRSVYYFKIPKMYALDGRR